MTKNKMRPLLRLLPVVGFLFLFFINPGLISATDNMNNYCVVPPYVQTGLPPNILIMMDNNTFSDPVGKGMMDPAYCTVNPPPASSTSLIICTDQYDPGQTYVGYFNSAVSYCVSSGEWVPSIALDSTCSGSVTVSGNILNWAGTSRFDLLEGILVGGVSTSRTSNPNDLHFTSNTWKKTLRYQDRNTNATYTCIFNMDSIKGLDIEDGPSEHCGYLDSTPAHPFDNTNYQIISSVGSTASYENYASADSFGGPRRTAFAGVVRSFAGKFFGAISAVFDFFSSDAEARTLAIQGGSSKLADANQCVPYNVSAPQSTITANGGSGSGYVWSISAGSLPAGMTLTNTSDTPAGALISGTPTATGTFNFTLQVTDSNNNTDTKAYSISVTPATVTITTANPLPAGNETVWYREYIQASSACTGANSWTITSGSLPSGLAMDSTDGSIYTYVYGTPSSVSAGTYNFTVRVTDSGGNAASQAFSLTIGSAPGGGLQITTVSPLPSGTEGSVYPAVAISTSGPCASCCGAGCNWTWSITSGSIPSGLTFNSSSGSFCYNGDHVYITGTPSNGSGSAVPYTFTVTVKDCSGSSTVSKTFSMTISPKQATRNPIGPAKKVCVSNTVGGTTYDCNTVQGNSCSSYNSSLGVANSPCFNAPYCSGADKCILRSGIVDQFWGQARFGLIDFNKQGGNAIPNIEYCTSSDPTTSYPDSNFLNQIENAVPIDPTTTLVNGEYTGIRDYYAYADQTPANCDPIDTHSCRKNFILMITAGVGADNPPPPPGGSPDILPTPPMPASCSAATNADLTQNACFGSTVDLRNNPANPTGTPAYGTNSLDGTQNVLTYVVNTMGTPWDGLAVYDGSTLPTTTGNMLYQTATKGGGNYYGVTNPAELKQYLIQAFKDILARAAAGTAASVLASGEGSGANLIQAVFYPKRRINNVDLLWTGRLTNYWYYVDPFFQSSNIYEDTDTDKYLNLSDDNMITLNYNGTLQATMANIYPPGHTSPTMSIPFEDTRSLWEAGAILFHRDVTADKRKIFTTTNTANLLSGNFSADSSNSSDFTGTNSDSDNSTTLLPYLNLTSSDTYSDLDGSGSVDSGDARVLINYIQGQDYPGYSNLRSRTVTMNLCSLSLMPCSNTCSVHTETSCTSDSGCPLGERCLNCPSGETCTSMNGVWKLSDILNSTPKISSQIKLNAYDTYYKDNIYYDGTSASFVGGANYTGRGMVFAGANDGMLHAFRLGSLTTGSGMSGGNVAHLGGTNLGREIWSFIPKNALPYLKYLTRNDYCHVYTVDLTPYVFDASIGVGGSGCSSGDYWDCTRTAGTWRTILIGGMRFGGGCRNTGAACNAVGTDTTECVQTPMSDPSHSSKGLGYSSYFALDVTDQNHPTLLWEFDGTVYDAGGNPSNILGFSTTGPSIVRIAARTTAAGATTSTSDVSDGLPGTKNGRWFVVFGSGPTGKIDTTSSQFMGKSDQNLKLVIFDLLQGPYDPDVRSGSTTWVVDTGIQNAFAGSMLNGSLDPNIDYQDDVVYVPYVKSDDGVSWTDGGVGRLITRTDLNGASTGANDDGTNNTALNPTTWVWSKVIDGIGPVTSAAAKIYDKNTDKLWLFFGTGRYFYKTATTMDDTTAGRNLFGVEDPCWSSSGFISDCTDSSTSNDHPLSKSTDLVNVTCSSCNGLTGSGLATCMAGCAVVPSDKKGWYIDLASSTSALGAERVTTDPLSTSTGVVFFTTLQPYTDACSLGGQTYIWAVTYNTGGSAGAILQGKALIQVSTGAIQQIDLASAFSEAGGRKSTSLEGVPPVNQGLSVMMGPPPVKKIIHMRER